MLCEWSAECGADDPAIVVPWRDPTGEARFVDLRADPYDFDRIPEADEHPPLMRALRALNAGRSPVFTSKCAAWGMDAEELEAFRIDLDADPGEIAAGLASYIDLVVRERTVFASFPQHEQMLRRLCRTASVVDRPRTMLECVIRPALVDLDGPMQGYAFSLYIKAGGFDEQAARGEWADALEAVVALVRSRDLLR